MDLDIRRIERVRRLCAPGHTAFKRQGFGRIRLPCSRQRETATRGDKPPPASPCNPCEPLDVSKAADLQCKVGCFCIFSLPVIRCRGPPLFLNSKKFRNGG